VAIYFGSILAVLTSVTSGLAAAHFLLPPKFSFYIDDPVHIAELGFTILLLLQEYGILQFSLPPRAPMCSAVHVTAVHLRDAILRDARPFLPQCMVRHSG
jgi:hypothetical protein